MWTVIFSQVVGGMPECCEYTVMCYLSLHSKLGYRLTKCYPIHTLDHSLNGCRLPKCCPVHTLNGCRLPKYYPVHSLNGCRLSKCYPTILLPRPFITVVNFTSQLTIGTCCWSLNIRSPNYTCHIHSLIHTSRCTHALTNVNGGIKRRVNSV